MRAIHHKLLRDLWQMKGQALAIVMVIASGVALFVGQLAVMHSLRVTRDAYYSEYRFADVFANCKRAPLSVADRLRDVPGVDVVQTRVTLRVMLEVPGLNEPATGQLISVPDSGEPQLNDLFIRKGRMPGPGTDNEVALVEMFAKANKYGLGDSITAIINGRRQSLRVVGIVLSPEYVYALSAGAFVPDDKRFAVMWMNEKQLAAAYNMEGAFNDVSASIKPGASHAEVIARFDDILKPYGGQGAFAQKDQVSNWYLANEYKQLETFGVVVPLIFLGIAAFLLNVVMSRVVATQRDQVAALKAFGYSNFQVGLHFSELVALIVLMGTIVGTLFGWLMGEKLIDLYTDFYHFPVLRFSLPGWVPLAGMAVTGSAAALGTLNAVRRAAALPPAEAMRPEAPPNYRMTLMERIGLQRWLSQPTRMILRQLERKPMKAGASILGLSLAVAILIVGMAFVDIIFTLIDIQANVVHREDVSVGFTEPRSRDALHEIESLPGVEYAEPYRAVSARVRFGHRNRRLGIQGIPFDTRLNRVLNTDLEPFDLPREGILLSRVLGDSLHVSPGDEIIVEVMEGTRPTRTVKVAALVDDFMGISAYMEIGSLNRLMREGDVISGAYLLTRGEASEALFERLRARPAVASVSSKATSIDNLRKMVEEQLLYSIAFNVLFAGIIAFGIVYNNARVSLSERARELASLRVLGLTRGEISFILLGEQALLTLVALPIGFVLGYWLTFAVMANVNSEVVRMPMVLNTSTYALGAICVIFAAAVSGLIVRHRLDRLDLVEVLKTRE